MDRDKLLKEAEECIRTNMILGDNWIHEVNYETNTVVFTVNGDDLANEVSLDEFVSYYDGEQ